MCVVPDRPSLPGDEPRALCLYFTGHADVDVQAPTHPPVSPGSPPACHSPDRASASPAMASATSHWGTLINPDKSPAPLLEQLCLGIAQLMVRYWTEKLAPRNSREGLTDCVRQPSFDSSPTTDLTPDRLAAFYRKVGGNYDPLFLETKTQALSFIYQSLGCFHSLQPSKSPYEPPFSPLAMPEWLRALADHSGAHGPG
ncbi:uncharacterized protein N7482_001531 [Penicillium canariense]|uniref:DUF7514 domain-containing protein n=1 Tax=Penicillium canariense TaxID=189055 RepID=A0A9W9LTZ5_9EURO|nr:uncharacterized protein N7482_001531 [Penicillium canariense]KAJ5175654.1 hypothetical protein N7482_001531 [Penicillium canariense]